MTETTTIDQRRVRYGMRCLRAYSEWLGEIPPTDDTDRGIDVETLDMADDYYCAIAQSISGEYYTGLRTLWEFLQHHRPDLIEGFGGASRFANRDEFAIAAGFNAPEVRTDDGMKFVPPAEYDRLNAVWREELES